MHDLVIRGGTVVDGTGAAPFKADVAIDGGLVSIVGTVEQQGREEIDATGKVVTPGFVDVHTHYDGQATWDAEMAPSSWHGVTTVVMGNCGVGFAPAAKDRHAWLISLMEGVEDIPGTALSEGMKLGLGDLPRISRRAGTAAAHGGRGHACAAWRGARLCAGGPRTTGCGANRCRCRGNGADRGRRRPRGRARFSTSRTVLHKSIDGELVPGTTATAEELVEIGRAMGRAGHGVFELASDLKREWNEFEWMGQISRETGLPVTFAALQSIAKELPLEEQISEMRAQNDNGANIVAAIALRGNGIIMAWQGTIHPFLFRPAWAEIAALPWDEKLAKLKDPAFKARMVGEDNVFPESDVGELLRIVAGGWMFQFEMDADFNYEPTQADTIMARAAAAGVAGESYAYDLLMKDEGKGFIYFPVLNYRDGNLDFLEDLQAAGDTINSLSDGGAHCGTICDAASPTFMLQHWVRDRAKARISLEHAIKRQCRDTALLYGLEDRGLLAPGYLADVNVIDMERLKLGKPWLAFDLPAGGKRFCKRQTAMMSRSNPGR
jgi:N-acyl-D-amino-acid deacylase